MGRLDTIKLVVEIGKTVHDAVIAHRDERARRAKEEREAEDRRKDAEIADLKRKLDEKATG